MSKEFKVGDKVRLEGASEDSAWSSDLVIKDISESGIYRYLCKNKQGDHARFSEDEIELIESEDQPFEIPKDFRFFRRSDGAISQAPYPTFEAALEGWRGFAQNGDETEIVELVSHGSYKATLKVEVVEPISEEA